MEKSLGVLVDSKPSKQCALGSEKAKSTQAFGTEVWLREVILLYLALSSPHLASTSSMGIPHTGKTSINCSEFSIRSPRQLRPQHRPYEERRGNWVHSAWRRNSFWRT